MRLLSKVDSFEARRGFEMALTQVRRNHPASICAAGINTSSIMVGNAASSMSRNPQNANAD